jgi:hypothetical protein
MGGSNTDGIFGGTIGTGTSKGSGESFGGSSIGIGRCGADNGRFGIGTGRSGTLGKGKSRGRFASSGKKTGTGTGIVSCDRRRATEATVGVILIGSYLAATLKRPPSALLLGGACRGADVLLKAEVFI